MKTLLISILILISFSSKAGNIWWVNYTKQQLFDAVPQKISNYKKEDFDFYSWTDEDLDAVIMVVYKENESLFNDMRLVVAEVLNKFINEKLI